MKHYLGYITQYDTLGIQNLKIPSQNKPGGL